MKICLAQIKPVKGALKANISKHLHFIGIAIEQGCDAIFFPELSLSGYEPELVEDLAFAIKDPMLLPFQKLSNKANITIGIGFPEKMGHGVSIGMGIFQPESTAFTYKKNYLHEDETPYFLPGKERISIKVDKEIITPAICYESLLPVHAEHILTDQSTIYLAAVAKPEKGILKANQHYPAIAKKYGVFVLMVNAVGFCNNFLSYGNSGVWAKNGESLEGLDHKNEGVLIFDTVSEKVILKESF